MNQIEAPYEGMILVIKLCDISYLYSKDFDK